MTSHEVPSDELLTAAAQWTITSHEPRHTVMADEEIEALFASPRPAGGGEAVAKYDDVLVPFVAAMRRELHANSGKGDRPGWLSMSRDTALLEIYWHVAKLSAAVKNDNAAAISEHAADVANMAMMLLDVCGGLKQ